MISCLTASSGALLAADEKETESQRGQSVEERESQINDMVTTMIIIMNANGKNGIHQSRPARYS